MTERQAINEILININELPLDDVDIIEDINIAVIADKFLEVARKQVLIEGWEFNSITLTLYPTINKQIVIPNTYLSVDSSTTSDSIVVRDWKLFDKAATSFVFEEGVEVDVIEDIVFDDIPYVLANYIVKIASLAAYSNIIGDVAGMEMRGKSMQLAKINSVRDEANKIDGNILSSTYATTLLDRTSI